MSTAGLFYWGCFLFGLNYVLAYRAQIYITSATYSDRVLFNRLDEHSQCTIILSVLRAGRRTILRFAVGRNAGIITLFAPQVRNLSFTDGSVPRFACWPYWVRWRRRSATWLRRVRKNVACPSCSPTPGACFTALLAVGNIVCLAAGHAFALRLIQLAT